jgi:hypothetical protein
MTITGSDFMKIGKPNRGENPEGFLLAAKRQALGLFLQLRLALLPSFLQAGGRGVDVGGYNPSRCFRPPT